MTNIKSKIINIITDDFKLLKKIVEQAKEFNVAIKLINESTKVNSPVLIITTDRENIKITKNIKIIFLERPEDIFYALAKAIYFLKHGKDWETLKLGIDPGKNIGVALVIDNILIYKSIFTGFENIKRFLNYIDKKFNIKQKIIYVGDKDRQFKDRILDVIKARYINSFEVHFVNEEYSSTNCSDDDAALKIIYAK